MRIAIIGAGIAGLACADALARGGHTPVVFDKGRGPGGRMSTRRAEADGRSLSFDHGAQYLTARDPAFVEEVRGWEAVGVAARWPVAGAAAWVGTPGMSAPGRHMAARHDVRSGVRVEALRRDGETWVLTGSDDPRGFDAVVVAIPAEQAGALLAPHRSDFAARADRTRSEPCWTAMAAFAEPIASARDLVRDAGPIGWAARNNAKPGRGDTECWVIQASPGWSAEHLEEPPEAVAPRLLAMLGTELGVALPAPVHLGAHRWRYARSGEKSGPGALWDPSIRLGACGDWLLAPRVEAAWLSGRRVAALIAAGIEAGVDR